MSSIIIRTPRLYLSEFSLKDAQGFFNMNNQPEVMQYTGDVPFESIEETQAFILDYNHYQKYGYGRWSVYRKEDDVYLGFCGLKHHIDTQEVDLGYRLDRQYWGSGYATEAAQACLDYGFSKLKLNRIIGRTESGNLASIGVLQKLGMHYVEDFDFNTRKGVIYEKYI